jgi:uncharacterized protein
MAEAEVSRAPQYQGHPTVRIDDAENVKVSGFINAFEVTEREAGLSSLELRLVNFAAQSGDDSGFAFEDERDIKLGSKLRLYAGDQATPREIFRGTVTGLEAEFSHAGTPELLILAEDALQLARMSRRTEVHADVKVADLARGVAQRASLTARVTGLSESIGTQVQLNESDLAFLRRLLARYDGDLQVVGDELHVSARSDVQRGSVDLELHGQLRRARFTVDLADQVTEVTTSGWDPAQGKRVAGTSRGANVGPGGGRSGASLLGPTLADRSEHISHPTVLNDTEAAALAEAAFDQRARRFVCVDGTAEGNPRIRVGTHLRLGGLSRRFNNTYYVVFARHRFDPRRGYETDFQAECAYLGSPAA